MPKRIQRKRIRGWRMPSDTKYVGRGSKYGNPYTVQPIGLTEWVVCEWDEIVSDKYRSRSEALAQCLEFYRMWVEIQLMFEPDFLAPLRGKDLACWCSESDVCHADTLLALAND